MTITPNGYIKHYFAESERILSNVACGGRPVVRPDEKLEAIVDDAYILSRDFTNFAENYFVNANDRSSICEKSNIDLSADLGELPDLREEYEHSLQARVPDRLYYFHADHLGSGSIITDNAGRTYQTLAYAPWGESLVNVRDVNQNYDEPYKFTGYEKDEETGLNQAKNRYYDSKLSIFYSVDALAEKFPNIAGYSYARNNPVNVIDPDGREGIVVTGSPGKEKMDQHFLINGLDRAKKTQARTEKGEGTTWMIYNDKEQGFNQEYLDKYTAQAKEAGINVKVVSEVEDVVNYINNKTGGDSRSNDQISSFYYVGHSTPGDLDVGYQGSGQTFDPSDLSSNAFKSGAWVNVVGGCRTAVDFTILGITFEKSIIRQFADILDTKSTIHGSDVRVVYPGGVAADKSLLRKNNGNIVTIKGRKK
jgi:RHS repeat-associated protein